MRVLCLIGGPQIMPQRFGGNLGALLSGRLASASPTGTRMRKGGLAGQLIFSDALRNHTRRTSHTISTITIIVPTKPKPNISPPSGYIGHQGYPCRYDRPDSGCRLIKTSHITDHRNGICALSDLLCLHYRQPRSTAPAIRGFGEACEPRIKFVKHTPMSYNTCGGAGDFSMFLRSRR